MITFKQYLEEAAKWTEDSFFITFAKEQRDNEGDVFIPLKPFMIKRTLGLVHMYAAHALGYENVHQLMKIQNIRTKSISAFTSESEYEGGGILSTRGVWGGFGIVAILKGDVLAGSDQDIISLVDKKGTRYVNISPEGGTITLLAKRRIKNTGGDFDKFKRDIIDLTDEIYELKEKIFRDEMKSNTALQQYIVDEKVIKSKVYFEGLMWLNQNDDRAKYRMMKAFLDGFEPILLKYKDTMYSILVAYAQLRSLGNKNSLSSTYDEIIMSNFKVVKFYVITDRELSGGLDGKLVAQKLKEEFNLPVIETTFKRIKSDISNELIELEKNDNI